ncbi:MAG: ribonuclease J [Clostridia bacterium]|nr:ribonuclease J [Clostridia bacterium]
MKKKNEKSLKVRFLGGVGEIGKNMTALEYGNDIIVIDAGNSFPTEDMPGVDLLIPETGWLEENKDKVRGYIITHGHEDHIGGLPYVVKNVNAPIFGTRLTLTLIENKLKENGLTSVSLNCVRPGATVKLGCFTIEFINVNHSIAGAVALSITTPVGVVFHSGDFKIDFTPVAGECIDLPRIAEIGKRGVTLLLCESTNVEREGFTMSETVVGETLDKVFASNMDRRLIIATFASNVHRIKQILDLAKKYRRKVVLSGRSMINVVEAASKIGEIDVPENIIIDVDKMKSFKPEQIVIISTGTQGEPMSALTRMASGEFNKVEIGSGDTVIMSSSVIPGNEKMIYGVINNLYKKGAEVLYETLEPIHVSGHACREEIKILHSLIKPKFFIPVHGEYRHLKKHADLAKELGTPASNIIIPEVGNTVEVTQKAIKSGDNFKAGTRLVDGIEIDGSDSVVLRDRIHISEDGIMVIVVCIDELSGELVSTEIINRGVLMNDSTLRELKEMLKKTLSGLDMKDDPDGQTVKTMVRKTIKNYIFRRTKKNPMILPIIMKV